MDTMSTFLTNLFLLPSIKMTNLKTEFTSQFVKLFINDLIHVSFKKNELYGFQSYIEGYGCKKYFIILYLERGKIKLEYDNWELWERILREFNLILS